MLYLSSTLVPKPPLSYRTLSVCQTPQPHRRRLRCGCYINDTLRVNREQNKTVLHSEENLRRRFLLLFLLTSGISTAFPCFGKTKSKNPYDERRLLQQNKRIQKENNAPDDFPNFIREGFSVKVVASENYVTRDSGLILWDIAVGKGFEEGLKDMKPGGRRRIIVPPELGPPVGPSTFFSSKQFEVFDVELLSIQDCTRRTIGFYSDVVCN